MTKLVLIAILTLPLCACGGGSDSPTAPTTPPPSTPTRIITLGGNLTFGDVVVGQSRSSTLTITNSGNSALTVSNLSVTGGLGAHTQSNWSSGSIAPGASQSVAINFAPTAAGNYSGSLSVNGDHTGGTNTIPISGTGVSAVPNFAGAWSGTYMVERCDGTGSIQDVLCSSRGAYPPGTLLPIQLALTQSGSSVSGMMALGSITGPVNGTVAGDGTLSLRGTATGGPNTISITSWSTRVQGNGLVGSATYDARNSVAPGVAVLVTRMNSVSR